MPGAVRKDGKAKRIALDILGEPIGGLRDSYGNKKRFRRKKDRNDVQEKINRFEEIGYR